jgi:hypothetical protein
MEWGNKAEDLFSHSTMLGFLSEEDKPAIS